MEDLESLLTTKKSKSATKVDSKKEIEKVEVVDVDAPKVVGKAYGLKRHNHIEWHLIEYTLTDKGYTSEIIRTDVKDLILRDLTQKYRRQVYFN